MDGSSNTRRQTESKPAAKPGKQSATTYDSSTNRASANLKTIGDFSFDVNNVTSKFARALQEKLNEEPPSLAGNGHLGGLSGQDFYHSDPERLNGASVRSRTDRIQAIKDTATTLQNRLKEEARKIQAQASYQSESKSLKLFYFLVLLNFCN